MAGKESGESIIPESEVLRLSEWQEPAARALACLAALAEGMLLFRSPARSSLSGSLRPVVGIAWLGFALLIASVARAGVIVSGTILVVLLLLTLLLSKAVSRQA